MVAFRYGADAQGLVFVLYDELIALRHILADNPGAYVVEAWVRDITRSLERRYREQPVATALDHPTAVVGTDPVVVEYSREMFERLYQKIMPIVRPGIRELTGPVQPGLRPGRPYMFVIDEDRRFLIWDRPFSFQELVFGRNRAAVAGVPVGHPIIVPDRLRASAAGEIVFIGGPRVRAVIVNNKSGHFRFPPSCRDLIVDRCRQVLELSDADIDVFIVGGFDEHLVHRSLVTGATAEAVRESPEIREDTGLRESHGAEAVLAGREGI